MSTAIRYETMTTAPLRFLSPGQLVPFGGDRVAVVSDQLAGEFAEGDRLVVVHETGDLLHIPGPEHDRVRRAVSGALEAFTELATVGDDEISMFFEEFAERLIDERVFVRIAAANSDDVERAVIAGRSTTRLELTPLMRSGMIDGLRAWQHASGRRDEQLACIDHGSWSVETRRAPLGVVGFVFEGRPNVFADATGVLRSGNTVVFRIGRDALGTARSIMEIAVAPALAAAGLPAGAVQLIDSPAHAAGWALFTDPRLGLAVARGSGGAVAQLGAVARQHGVPVSLHGTGGAWMVVASDADPGTVELAVLNSLDRKVCNTLNVCCIERVGAEWMVPAVMGAVSEAARRLGTEPVFHLTPSARELVPHGDVTLGIADVVDITDLADLGTEWEWEDSPEVSIAVVDSVADAVALFNELSPRFSASLIGGSPAEQQRFYDTIDSPFVGNGFTRWVDGQFAFVQPELGLSNWQSGRLFARGGVLSGDSVFTIRTRATVVDHTVHR